MPCSKKWRQDIEVWSLSLAAIHSMRLQYHPRVGVDVSLKYCNRMAMVCNPQTRPYVESTLKLYHVEITKACDDNLNQAEPSRRNQTWKLHTYVHHVARSRRDWSSAPPTTSCSIREIQFGCNRHLLKSTLLVEIFLRSNSFHFKRGKRL